MGGIHQMFQYNKKSKNGRIAKSSVGKLRRSQKGGNEYKVTTIDRTRGIHLLKFLKEYYDYEEPNGIKDVNCHDPKYFCRVVEDELITGFLTNTDQFVPIKDPIPIASVPDTIKTITSNDFLVADINTLTNNNVDNALFQKVFRSFGNRIKKE